MVIMRRIWVTEWVIRENHISEYLEKRSVTQDWVTSFFCAID